MNVVCRTANAYSFAERRFWHYKATWLVRLRQTVRIETWATQHIQVYGPLQTLLLSAAPLFSLWREKKIPSTESHFLLGSCAFQFSAAKNTPTQPRPPILRANPCHVQMPYRTWNALSRPRPNLAVVAVSNVRKAGAAAPTIVVLKVILKNLNGWYNTFSILETLVRATRYKHTTSRRLRTTALHVAFWSWSCW